jgi:hypothetical protein
MPRCALSSVARIAWLSVLVAIVLFLVHGARAQQEQFGSIKDLEEGKRKHEAAFEKFLKGEETPGAGDKAVLDAYAQYYIYMMTQPEYQAKKGALRNIVQNFDLRLKGAVESFPKNKEFMKQWTDRVVFAFKEVLGPRYLEGKVGGNRVSLVRVSMLLPLFAGTAAKTKQENFSIFLEGLLAEPKQHDVTKLYALKALREYFPARPSKTADEADDKKLQETIANDKRRVQAVLNFLNRPWDKMDTAVAQFIRREALRTLADAEVPAMKAKDGKVELPAAYELVRALASKDGLTPSPDLTEKCEAAIGVCKMKAKWIEEYQPEPGLYLLGRFLVEFVNDYTKDYPNFAVKGKQTVKSIPRLPWKLEAKRLLKALDELDGNLQAGTAVHAKARTLVGTAKVFLGTIGTLGRIDQGDVPALHKMVESLTPANGELFKGNKKFQVDLSAPVAD